MANFFRSNTPLIVLVLIFVIAEIIVHPTGDFPLNDDWAFSNSVKLYVESGKFDPGNWGIMSLVGHLVFGMMVCKVFGFSFLILRLSTIGLVVASAILFYSLLYRVSGNRKNASVLCAFFLFNPLVFSLANTFMTDVPFLFSVVLVLYFAERYFSTSNRKWLVFLSLACAYSVSIRQYGIAGGAALLFLVPFAKGRQRWMLLIPLLAGTASYFIVAKIIRATVGSGSLVTIDSVLNKISFGVILPNVWKFTQLAMYTGFFLFPFLIVAVLYYLKKFGWKKNLIVLVFSSVISACLLFFATEFPRGNVMYNLGLGTPTFFESTIQGHLVERNKSEIFDFVLTWTARLGFFLVDFVFVACATQLIEKIARRNSFDFFRAFLFAFGCSVLVLVFITDSFFDRYWLPLLPLFLLFFAFLRFYPQLLKGFVAFYLFASILFAVSGTRDYFEWNKARWQLIDRALTKIPDPLQLNGGIEYFGAKITNAPYGWWWCYTSKDWYYYVGFQKYDTSRYMVADFQTYQRLLPFKRDTLYLSKRKDLK